MAKSRTGLVIAGTHSGCGKTQAALALASALSERGLIVQGYKIGPDFIDPSHMSAVTGRATHNLDGWMMSRDAVLKLYQSSSTGADVCVVEGVMGLFDGASGKHESGSTAQMAKWLGLPVILVVDARSQGRSAAALIRGFRDFDPDLGVAGVLFTMVGGTGHKQMLREAMAKYLPDLPCFGMLPRRPDLAMPSRHLGLYMAQDLAQNHAGQAGRKTSLAAWIEQDADVQGLLSLTKTQAYPQVGLQIDPGTCMDTAMETDMETDMGVEIAGGPNHSGMKGSNQNLVRLAVARDRAFCFYYQENLDLLRRAGAELVFFSPLEDKALPDDVQGIYFGGGYPELHASELSANESMRVHVRRAALEGMPVYAECGGLLYLLSNLENSKGLVFPMAGIFPLQARMHSRFQALGYREVVLASDCLLGRAGTVLRGHEFHYSALKNDQDHEAQNSYLARDRLGREFAAGFTRGNVLASFIHLHFTSQPQSAEALVAACARWPKNQLKDL